MLCVCACVFCEWDSGYCSVCAYVFRTTSARFRTQASPTCQPQLRPRDLLHRRQRRRQRQLQYEFAVGAERQPRLRRRVDDLEDLRGRLLVSRRRRGRRGLAVAGWGAGLSGCVGGGSSRVCTGGSHMHARMQTLLARMRQQCRMGDVWHLQLTIGATPSRAAERPARACGAWEEAPPAAAAGAPGLP